MKDFGWLPVQVKFTRNVGGWMCVCVSVRVCETFVVSVRVCVLCVSTLRWDFSVVSKSEDFYQ